MRVLPALVYPQRIGISTSHILCRSSLTSSLSLLSISCPHFRLHCLQIFTVVESYSFSLAHMSFVIVVPGASSDEGLKLLDLSQLSRHLLGREDSPPFRPPGAQQSQSKHRWQLHTILRSHSFLSSGMQERRDPPNHARKAATDAILRSEVRTQIFR